MIALQLAVSRSPVALLTRSIVKTNISDMKTVETLSSPRRAACILLHPLRPRILAQAREPVSAAELARRLGQPRQRVNYHVRQLAREGLLEAVGQQRRRNMVEQQYQASARAYVMAAGVLGEAAPSAAGAQDEAAAEQLLALCGRAQHDLAQLIDAANDAGVRVRTVSMHGDVGFQSAAQRAAFMRELTGAINGVVARYHDVGSSGSFRFLLGCYPIPE